MKVKFAKKVRLTGDSSDVSGDASIYLGVKGESYQEGQSVADYILVRRGDVNAKGKVVWDKPKA